MNKSQTPSALPAGFLKQCASAARLFDARRARRDTIRLWKEARRMDTPAVYRAVEAAAGLLRGAGIQDVRIENVPADGKTAYNGWLMPLAWEIHEGWLRSAPVRGRAADCFADYADDPQSVAVGCPSTPEGRIVEGPVVVVDDPAVVGKLRLKGRFLLLTSGKGTIDLNVMAARKGALGVLVMAGGATTRGRAFLNAAVPMDDRRPCVPCFSLSKAAAQRLTAQLGRDPGFRLRALVKARRYAGTAPMLTGTIGDGAPAVYVCAHIDEIGALDNASGCGVAIETLRALSRLQRTKGVAPQVRAIRFLFSTEVRGQQAWVNLQKSMPKFLGGINLDMVGSGAAAEVMVGRRGFRHRPHFARHLLEAAMALANRIEKGIPQEVGANSVSDGIAGIYPPGGNVSIEQRTGPTYHSSDDVPGMLDERALRWSGSAATAFLFAMTRMQAKEVLSLARHIRGTALQGVGKDDFPRVGTHALLELKSLEYALPPVHAVYGLTAAADYYRQGVSRRSGLRQEVVDAAELRRATCDVKKALAAVKAAPAPVVPAAARKAPLALQRGFLNFDDHVTDAQVRKLKEATGLGVGWCTESWAWIVASCFDGKHTVADVAAYLQSLGINVDVNRVVALADYLAGIGLVRMRPVLSKAAFVKALRKVGVRRGSALMVHSSLSAYGYVEGGAATVVAALREVLGPRGTLLMPTHSNSILGVAPYDPASSPSNTGAVTEYFRKLPGVIRGAHPTHSVAGIGPAAADMVGSQRVDQAPLARDGFWGRLYDAGGDVLLLCPIRSATAFHVGETWLGLPQSPLVVHAVDKAGRRRVYNVPNGPWHVNHFDDTMAQPLLKRGIMKQAVLGESTIYLAPVRAMIDISMEVNRLNPFVTIPRNGGCTCFYCAGLKAGLAAKGVEMECAG